MKFGIAALIAFALSAPAHSATVFFAEDLNAQTNGFPLSQAAETSFLAALTGVGTEDFEGISSGTSNPTLNFGATGTASLTGSGSVSTSTANNLFPTSGTNYFRTPPGLDFGIEFSSHIAAFGFYATDAGDANQQISLDFFSDNTLLFSQDINHTLGANADAAALYFGIIDLANPFNRIEFSATGSGDRFGFDDMTIGNASQVINPVPEPATLLYLGTGLVGLVGLRWRRRSRV